ncbi:hypothetical protein SteCoe_21157 [Stentor coeruleus]|uniref:EF-hand domain-containing protein n=1 Tax=Stentor coeruleus TaxID=5963 RepID=A0A1R2BQD9_9CILI|nr:hypothetical protein SteCoe_21157 [Stentor coeruleus]
MGGLVSSFNFNREDPIIQSLSQINAREVEEALSYYIDEYPNMLRVTFRRFDDIFGGTLIDVERFFLFFSDGKPEADLLEIFAALIIACKGMAEWKVKMLFCLFDFDNSENIDKNELSLVLSAFTKALSKLASGTPPSVSKLYIIAANIFKEIDKDNSQTLELEEIIDWTGKNEEFQDLMAHFSHIQSLDLAKIRFDHSLAEFTSFLPVEVLNDSSKNTILRFFTNKSFSLREIEDMLSHISNWENRIDKDKLEKYAKGMIGFYISDFTGQQKLAKSELQILLSLLGGEQKPLSVIEDFMRKHGISRTGYLTSSSWLQVLYKETF